MLDQQAHLDADHLADYLRGELDSDAEARVEAHISSCLVCARRLQAAAQLEELMYAAAEDLPATAAVVVRPPVWRRVVATAALTAAAAAALVLAVAPASLQTPASTDAVAQQQGASFDASAFVNDALCFPAEAIADAEVCVEPLAVAMTTDPEDYLSPFDPDSMRPFGRDDARATAMCLEEGPACDPSAG
ncbi:MAG: zf-HC2 domain-containing protein [Myxococcota bacterium]